MPEITYTGHTAIPSDYECADGQLALSLNLINENGSLQPLFSPSIIFTLPTDYKVAYIHKTTDFTHYIITRKDNAVNVEEKEESGETTINPSIYYIDEKNAVGDKSDINDPDYIPLGDIDGTEITAIQAVGNTLIIVTKEAMNYYLWKTDEDNNSYYAYLGTHLPELDLSFGLVGLTKMTDVFSVTFSEEEATDVAHNFNEDNVQEITEQVMAQVNSFVAENSTNAGKFLFPFFVRYAFRLYDGSFTMQSAPILMIASSGASPFVLNVADSVGGDAKEFKSMRVVGVSHDLDYCVLDEEQLATLKNWEDIITSVDIFISAPIYTYEQGGDCERYEVTMPDTYCVSRLIGTLTSGLYMRKTFTELFSQLALSESGKAMTPSYHIQLPVKSDEQIIDDIKSCCNFYFLKSIGIDDLQTERTTIDVADDYLQSLVNREQLPDDYDSHDALLPSFAYNYNSRLNIANIRKRLYQGYNPASMFCYTNGYVSTLGDQEETNIINTYIFIREDNKNIVVKSKAGYLSVFGGVFLYIYYPNTSAYKALINPYYQDRWYEVKLTPHDFLNGAFYFDDWENPELLRTAPSHDVSTDPTVLIANKIYNSEINNPFFFPVENIVTVGTGTILGIATAAKALSQGQFGSFPLYAFCDDGVWALSVSTEGVYSAVQPITRDVCINPSAITQLDSSVLFPTDRGIMHISGSETECLTDILNGQNTFDITTLPAYDELLTLAGHNEITIRPIYELLEKCIIIYDYTNQHIYVCDDEYNMAYVISSKSNAWGMAAVDIQSTVNSYPEAYAMSGDNFVDFSHPDKTNPQNCFLITRPLKLEDPNAFKTVTAVIQRGYFNKEHIQTALYGSRDLMHWHLVRSSTSHEIRAFAGTPYKYFRIATLAQLQKDEAIFGATINAIKRFTNKER